MTDFVEPYAIAIGQKVAVKLQLDLSCVCTKTRGCSLVMTAVYGPFMLPLGIVFASIWMPGFVAANVIGKRYTAWALQPRQGRLFVSVYVSSTLGAL